MNEAVDLVLCCMCACFFLEEEGAGENDNDNEDDEGNYDSFHGDDDWLARAFKSVQRTAVLKAKKVPSSL